MCPDALNMEQTIPLIYNMKSIIPAWIIVFSLSGSVAGQSPVKKSLLYLEQEVPGSVPKVFAPGLVSLNDRFEFGSFFSKDGKEFYYAVDSAGKAEIRFMQFKNDQWTDKASKAGGG